MGPLHCVGCDKPVPVDAPGGFCPRCLTAAALTDSAGPRPQDDSSLESTGSSRPIRPSIAPGDRFGPYRVHQLLGRGGMGEVYEAEHVDHHRRLAIKVLRGAIRGDEARVRLRLEGELAASATHPNLVYVFGCDEIDGVPVMAMELLPGRTLKDQVARYGPMSPAHAVDAILQVIAGLDAAGRAGVLHRDIKPSNCFIDRDGTVKVGDFGLSVLRSRQGVGPGEWFQGTPAFAAPEQQRGEALSVRADLYSVGATLFYLLKGQPPAGDVADIWDDFGAARVPLVRSDQPGAPGELDRLVARCLARDPDDRFASFSDLAAALVPFCSAAITPAPWGRRLAAGLLDGVYIMPAQGLTLAALVVFHPTLHPTVALACALFLPPLVYHAVAEHCWGATAGLRECRLRVATPGGGRPRLFVSLIRAAIVLVPTAVAFGLLSNGTADSAPVLSSHLWAGVAFAGATGLVFATATGRNGYAGIHDWLTGTRLVARPEVFQSPSPPDRTAVSPPSTAPAFIGPYAVVGDAGPTTDGRLLHGFDPSLKRAVWIHVVRAGAREVSSSSRNGRPLRVRWLGGERTALGGWDAYEALDGSALLSLDKPCSWPLVCRALRDLAIDIQADLDQDVALSLSLERVWITSQGTVRLLDFALPAARKDQSPDAGSPTPGDPQRFLYAVAARALGLPTKRPLSLSAASVLSGLRAASYGTFGEVASILIRLSQQPAGVTVARRSTVLGLGIVTTALATHAIRGYLTAHAVTVAGLGSSACALAALLGAFVFRGGILLRAFGIAVVTADGREVSRFRAVGRTLLAWSWVPIQILATLHGWMPVNVLAGVGKLAGVIWSTADPARGPHDRLVRTYLVPR